MNWLIWEKMITSLYNKLLPVKWHALYNMCCKQFITHILLVAAEVLWHLRSPFYHSTQYSQRGWFTNLLLCDIPQNNAPSTGPHHIWCIYTLPFFWPSQAHRQQRISLATVCYGPRVAKYFLGPQLFLQPIWGWGDLGSFQLPQSTSVYPKVPGQCL